MSRHFGEDVADRHRRAAVKGVGGIAVAAAQRAAGKADENCRQADAARLALERKEDLGDAECRGRELRGRRIGRGDRHAYLSVESRRFALSAASLDGYRVTM